MGAEYIRNVWNSYYSWMTSGGARRSWSWSTAGPSKERWSSMATLQESTTLSERGVSPELLQHMLLSVCSNTTTQKLLKCITDIFLHFDVLLFDNYPVNYYYCYYYFLLCVGGMLRFLAGKIIPLSRSWHWLLPHFIWLETLADPLLTSDTSAVCRVPLLRILLTNTKVPRSTKVLVSRVKEKINKVLNGLLAPIFVLVASVIKVIGS